MANEDDDGSGERRTPLPTPPGAHAQRTWQASEPIVHYHPHDLRDRRISLWIAQGIDPVQAKTWSGHTKASMTLDVYAHVVIDPEADEWRQFWQDVYASRSTQSPRKRMD